MPGGAFNDDVCTWDVAPSDGGARRASLEDLGGAHVEDDVPGPDKGKDLFAGLVNEFGRQLAGVNRIIGAARVWVRVWAGTPSVYRATGMGLVVDATFFRVTKVATGVFQITWTEGSLPPMVGEPETSLNSGPGQIWGVWMPNTPNGVAIHTTDGSGQPGDQNFVVTLL